VGAVENETKILYLLMIGFTVIGVGLSFKYYLTLDPAVRYAMHIVYVFALLTAAYLLAKSSIPTEQCEKA